ASQCSRRAYGKKPWKSDAKPIWHGDCIMSVVKFTACIAPAGCRPELRRKEGMDNGIRKALRPARDGAPAAQPAHDDARLEHRQCRHAPLQGPRPRLLEGARSGAEWRLDRGRDRIS